MGKHAQESYVSGAIDALNTDAIEEGSSNLYFTNQRALDATVATIGSASAAAVASASAYTNSQISNLVDSAPGALDTLNELSAALNDDANFATTVTNSLAAKLDASSASTTYAPIASPTFTGQIRMGLGSATNPSLTFTGNVNAGIWSPTTNTIAISTSGTERVRVTSIGNIGIGTTSPEARFHEKNGDVIFETGDSTTQYSYQMLFNRNRNGAAVQSGDYLGQLTFKGHDGTWHQNAAAIRAIVDGTPGTNDMPGLLSFWTTPDGSTTLTERMRIDAAGNVGIGKTASAGILLDVNGKGAFSDILTAPTAAVNTNTTQVATTAYVVGQGYAKLASPTFTGTVTVPTPVNSTDAATKAYVDSVVINTQTASYQLALADAGEVIEMNVATANNLTVPASGTVNFPIGTSIDIVQYGAGQTTIVAAGGVTIRSKDGNLKLTGQYSGATLYKRGTDEWVVVGDLTT